MHINLIHLPSPEKRPQEICIKVHFVISQKLQEHGLSTILSFYIYIHTHT